MSDPIAVQKVTNALVALLRDQLQPAGVQVYDQIVPVDTPQHYACVYSFPGGEYGGPPLTNPDVDVTEWYQVDAVGRRRDQAEWVADKVSAMILGRENGAFKYPLALPVEISECDRMRSDVPGGVEQEGVSPNAVLTVPQRFAISSYAVNLLIPGAWKE